VGTLVMSVAWYRFRATFRRSVTSDLTVVLLIGLIGGVGALIFTNLVAMLPGRSAARISTALVLRAE
jgi:hypothetical protein